MNRSKLLKLFIIFLPVAYFSYLFHEFGHWIIGELLGNDMSYSLNNVDVKNGAFINENHRLLSSIGGPLFTILQSLIFLVIIEKYQNIYFYPFVFFAFFIRFFAMAFGGFENQDEAVISSMLNAGKYSVALVVIFILLLMVWRASKRLGINLKYNGIFFAISTFYIILVIITDKFIL